MNEELDELRSEIQRLRAELVEVRARVDASDEATRSVSPSAATTRRAFFGIAAGVGAGALMGARPVAAANGQAVRLGQIGESTETTEIKYPGSLAGASPRGHVFVAQDGVWSTPASPNATSTAETGTRAAVAGYSGNDAMHGMFGQTNSSLAGASGGRFLGEGPAAYGLTVAGRRATIRLGRPDGPQTPPPSRFDAHNVGELTLDDNNDLWLCVSAGNPGTWRRVAGPSTAGSYVAINPVRVFDSRLAAIPSSGVFAAGSSRVLSVTRAYDLQGRPTANNVVPTGATAVSFNVTAAGNTTGNFLAVTPGDATSFSTSTLNWSGGGSVANASTVKLDGSRRVKIFMGPGGPTHVILDITGYYR